MRRTTSDARGCAPARRLAFPFPSDRRSPTQLRTWRVRSFSTATNRRRNPIRLRLPDRYARAIPKHQGAECSPMECLRRRLQAKANDDGKRTNYTRANISIRHPLVISFYFFPARARMPLGDGQDPEAHRVLQWRRPSARRPSTELAGPTGRQVNWKLHHKCHSCSCMKKIP